MVWQQAALEGSRCHVRQLMQQLDEVLEVKNSLEQRVCALEALVQRNAPHEVPSAPVPTQVRTN